MTRTTKKTTPHNAGRSVETKVLSGFTVRWWDIKGDVPDDHLIEHAEERIQECIAQGYSCGALYHDDGESSATGWWEH